MFYLEKTNVFLFYFIPGKKFLCFEWKIPNKNQEEADTQHLGLWLY